MKKLLLFFLAAAVAVVTVSACGAAMTAADKANIEQSVQENLANKDYTIYIQLMIPSAGPTRAVSNYSIKVAGDTLVSYLPFIGRAYNLPYGGGKGLDFTAKINEYHDVANAGGGHDIFINVANDEDVYFYSINVTTNGSAFISVSSRNRERISYTGEMLLP
jgi:hypothetical protein